MKPKIATNKNSLKHKLHEIIFESDTSAGRLFDVCLVILILVSVLVVLLESVPSIKSDYGRALYKIEWFFTVIFIVEYVLRIYCSERPMKYVTSVFGIIDLLACIPTPLSVIYPGAQSLLIVRAFRLLRIFRIFKLGWYFNEGVLLIDALKAGRAKITVFLFAVTIIITVAGSAMYLIEGPTAGFVSIPVSMYWAVVTLTTVGYGDIAPKTGFGQFLASAIMILGYAIIAVPTGILTSELTTRRQRKAVTNIICLGCGAEGHDPDAVYCKYCGRKLPTVSVQTPT